MTASVNEMVPRLNVFIHVSVRPLEVPLAKFFARSKGVKSHQINEFESGGALYSRPRLDLPLNHARMLLL